MSGCLSQVYSCAPGHGGVAVAAGTYGAGCCARARAAVVAAASEATRGLQNERFERFERPPVNSPTYVACQPPCLWESMQPQELELNRAASITRASSGASGSRIELQLATTAALLTIVRRKHGMPQRPVMQYLQGVALRRTCRIDGVRVTVHCAQRRPSAAHRNAPLRGGGGEVEAALRRPGLRGNGVSTCRCASGSERRRSRTRRSPASWRRWSPLRASRGPPALRSRRAAYGEGRR